MPVLGYLPQTHLCVKAAAAAVMRMPHQFWMLAVLLCGSSPLWLQAEKLTAQTVVGPSAKAPAPRAPMPYGGSDPAYKTSVPCPKAGPRTMVMVPAGQSNAANYGGGLTRSAFGAR